MVSFECEACMFSNTILSADILQYAKLNSLYTNSEMMALNNAHLAKILQLCPISFINLVHLFSVSIFMVGVVNMMINAAEAPAYPHM